MKVKRFSDDSMVVKFWDGGGETLAGYNRGRDWTPMMYTPLGRLYTEGMMIAL